MRKNYKIVILFGVIVMICFAVVINSFDKDIETDGEFNMEGISEGNSLTYPPYTSATDGYDYVVVWIHALNTSEKEGYSTNPAKWIATIDDIEYEYDSHATYRHPEYAGTLEIIGEDSDITFPIVYLMPDGTASYSLRYDSGNFHADGNADLAVIIPADD